MGRSKPVPKRRRIDKEEAQAKAIETLRAASQEDVENAAVHVIRSGLPKWKKFDANLASSSGGGDNDELPTKSNRTEAFDGLDLLMKVDDFEAFEELHNVIKAKASTWTSWSGLVTDPRKRAFGFVPRSLGYEKDVRDMLDISMPDTNEIDAAKERPRNEQAIVILSEHDMPKNFYSALETLLISLRSRSRTPDSIKKYLTLDQLVTAQPNLHSGRHLLPAHVDHPTKDGYGIIIVTIAIKGDATIMLESADRKHQLAMELKEKSAYMLSGMVRNSCTHGVLADEASSGRESLNLRFGLHGRTPEDPREDEVLQYWRDDKV